MASYTDIIPKFNPYIDQIPVEAMVQVGMEKQRRYEEGVQKVQTYLDGLAGLDVARPVDKAYLQSKFNELGNNLRGVAGGDFSNFQLVNSVGGMAKQLVNDPYILNAVSSTKLYRKSLEEIDTARKDGKSGPSNEWDFRNQASKWLDSNELGASFNGRYTPFTNWKKEGIDVLNALKPGSNITEDAFTVDKNGNVVIADAIVREKLAGISPERIQQALLTGLTPAAFKQMEIDGRYNYSNVSPDQFVKDVNTQYSDKVQRYMDQIKTLDATKYQTKSTAQKSLIDSKIADIRKIIESTKNEYAGVSKSFASGDVESAKARLQTINNLNGFANAFSYTETSKTYENSPFVQAQQFRDTKEWEREKFEEEKKIKKQELDLKRAELEIEMTKLGMSGRGGIPSGATAEEVGGYNMGVLQGRIEDDKKALVTNEAALLNRPEYQGKDIAWLAEQKAAWERSPKSVDPVLAQYFINTENLSRSIKANEALRGAIYTQVDNEKGTLESLIPKGSPTITYKGYSYTPEELVQFNEKFKKYVQTGALVTSPGQPGGVQYNDEAARYELSPKELLLYQVRRKGGVGVDVGEKAIMDNLSFYNKNVNQPYSDKIKERIARANELLLERTHGMQAVTYTIDSYKPELRQNLSGLLNGLALNAEKQGGGLAGSPGFSADTAKKLATDPSLIGSIRVIEGTELQPAMYEVTTTGKDGTSMSFKITPEQKVSYFGSTTFESAPEIKAIQPYLAQLYKTGGVSTATAPGPTTPNNSYLASIDFPSVDIYGVKGNLIQSGGLYQVKLTVFDPIKKEWVNDVSYPRGGLMQKEKIAAAMSNLNDSAIFELLYDRPPTAAELKAIKEASNIP
jgi:hypothetical protein